MLNLLVQSSINGISIGTLYGLVAVGLSLIFGVMKVLNVAYGEFVVLGGYISFWLLTFFHIDPFLSIPLVAILLFIVGSILYKTILANVSSMQEDLRLKNSLLITFGLSLMTPQIFTAVWTADVRSITPAYSGTSLAIFDYRIGFIPLLSIITCLIIVFALQLFLNKTYFGKSVVATSQSWKGARIVGINVDRTYLITFGIGLAIAGIAGVMIGLIQSLTPVVGMHWTLKALIVVVLAGMGNLWGALIAGIILGIAEAVGVIYMGQYASVIGLVFFLLILMFRPQGLFGKS